MRTGWIERLIWDAERAVEDLDAIDRDAHGPNVGPCSFCDTRRALSRDVKMAKRQLMAIQLADDRRKFEATKNAGTSHRRSG